MGQEPKTISNAERQRRFREKRRARDSQMAIALAKLVLGEPLGDHSRLLRKELEKARAKSGLSDDDQLRLLDNALDRLPDRRRGY